jgi:signal transduction histidine kinase
MTQTSILPQISHDLRNYISGISGLANIILEDISSYQKKQISQGIKPDRDLQEASELANMLAPYSHEAMQYVDDMLDLSQIETGKFTLGSIEECDLKSVIDRLLIFNKSFIKNHQITVQTNISPNLPKLKCDVRRLKQILTNLITNAVKYSPKNSTIIIDVRSKKAVIKKDVKKTTPTKSGNVLARNDHHQSGLEQDQIVISIKDQGIGMSESEIKMALLGKGSQIDKSSLKKPIDSHGLGMPIVKQLVDLMKGQMEIESRKGKGTKISLEFLMS